MKQVQLFLFLIIMLQEIYAQPSFNTGVNFPFRSPETTDIDDFLTRLNETGTKAMRQMTYADVYWKDVEPTDNNWNFVTSDSAYFNSFNITPVGELFSIMGNDTIGIQVPWKACTNPITCYWNPATDSLETKDYISTVINRYKTVTKYWEITNEFENVGKPRGLPMMQKRDFLQYCYNWIKQTDSNANVLLPALLGTYGYPIESGYAWLRTFLSIGGGNSFDIMNYHDYNSWWTLPLHYDSISTVLNDFGNNSKPIWITETSISSVDSSPITPDYSSVDEQAADVWRRLSLLWAKGAEVVFWHSHWSSGDLTGWGEFGLLDHWGNKKKSFHSYRLLMDKVANFSSVSALTYGNITNDNDSGGNGTWAIEFVVDGQKKWLLWSPDNQPYTINNISTNQISVTDVVPGYISPSGDSASFNTSILSVSGTSYTFNNLTSLPILVEEFTTNSTSENNDNEVDIIIFPNPADNYFTVTLPNTQNHATLTLLSSTGQLLQKKQILNDAVIVKSDNLKSGIYLIQIMDKNGIVIGTKKLIIR